MKKLYYLTLLFVVSILNAGTGIYGSYAIVDDAYYNCKSSDSDKTDFNGNDFGAFTVSSTLMINGGEVKTWKDNGGDITGAYMYYRVYKTGTAEPDFTEIQLSWVEDGIDSSSNNQKWAKTDEENNLLSGLSTGSYTLEVYFKATTNEGDVLDDNSGDYYVATFSYTAGLALESDVLISTLNRNTQETTKKNGLLVLESKEKGFVITTIPSGETTDIIAAPVQGMLVFDEDNNCLKMYNGTQWGCINQVSKP